MAENAGTIYSDVRIQLDKLKADVANVQLNINQLKTSNQTAAATTQTAWTKSFKGISAGGLAMTVALTAAFKKMVGTFATTEQSLANVRAVTGATAEEFEVLKNAAEEAGRTTRFTASQSADALYYLASAGFSATESVDALNGVLTLAGATGSDLAMTSETVASAISAFNLEAADADRVANVFAASISNSQATMDKLAISMRYVAPVASAFGRTIEETAGLLQILYNNGFEASQAGTALRGALGDLANKSGPAIAKLEKLGVTFNEVNPQTNSLSDIFGVLNEKVTDASDILSVFGDRAGPAIIKLVQAGKEEIDKYTEAVTGTNSAAEQYAIQNDTLAGSFDMFKSALESTTNSIIEQLAPAFRALLGIVTKVLNFITSLPKSLKAVAGGMGTAALAVGILSRAMTLLGIASSAALGPIGLILGAVIGLGAAIANATKPARDMAKSFKVIASSSADAEQDTSGLIDRFQELKTKTELTVTEQKEYYEIIEKLKKSIPGLTDELLDNEEALLREAIAQKEANKAKTQAALDKAISKQLEYRKEVEAAEENLKKENYELYKQLRLSGQLDDYLRENVISYGVASESVKNMQEIIDIGNQSINNYNSELKDLNEQLDEFSKKTQEAAGSQNGLTGDEETQFERLTKLFENYTKAVERAKFERSIGLIDDIELLKERIRLKEEYIRAVIDEGYNDKTVLKERTAELDALKKQLEELLALEKETVENYKYQYTIKDELDRKERERLQESIDFYNERNDERRAREEEKEKEHAANIIAIRNQIVEQSLNLANYLFQAMEEIGRNNTQNEITRIEEEKQAQINAINERLKAGIISEEQAAEERKTIEEKSAHDSAELNYRQALDAWRLQGLQILANVAVGITKALATADYIGAAFVGAQGIIQGLAHASAKPQPPSLQTGAIIRPQPGGTLVRVAENNNPELALNAGPEGEAFLNMFADRVADRMGSGPAVNIYQNNTLNTDSLESLQNAARALAPALKQEAKRSGNG